MFIELICIDSGEPVKGLINVDRISTVEPDEDTDHGPTCTLCVRVGSEPNMLRALGTIDDFADILGE